MNVYEFNIEGVKEWIAANNKKEAIEFYSIENNYDESVVIKRLSKKEIKESEVFDPNEYYSDVEDIPEDQKHLYNEEGYLVIGTFEEMIKGLKYPEILATTYF